MELTQKGEMVSRLQAKASQIGKILNNLEKYNHLVKEGDKKAERKPPMKPSKSCAERRDVVTFNQKPGKSEKCDVVEAVDGKEKERNDEASN